MSFCTKKGCGILLVLGILVGGCADPAKICMVYDHGTQHCAATLADFNRRHNEQAFGKAMSNAFGAPTTTCTSRCKGTTCTATCF